MKRKQHFLLFFLIAILPFLYGIAYLIGFNKSASAAVTLDRTSTPASAPIGNTISWSHTTGNFPNRILFVGVTSDPIVNSVTYNGQPLTNIASRDYNVAGGVVSLWYLKNPPVGTYTIAVTAATGGNLSGIGAATLYNVDQVSTFLDTRTAQFPGNGNLSFPGTDPTNTVIAALGMEEPPIPSFGGGITQIWHGQLSVESNRGVLVPANAGTTTISVNSSEDWAMIGVVLNAAAPTPTPTPIPPTPTPIPPTPTRTPTPTITPLPTAPPTSIPTPTTTVTSCVLPYTSTQPWVKQFTDYPSVFHAVSLTVAGITVTGEAEDHVGGDLITSDQSPIYTNPLPGRSLLLSGTENFTVDFSTPVYGFAFDYFEPITHPSVNNATDNSAIVDTTFQVTLYNNGTVVRIFTFNGPNDVVSTQGIWLDKQFNKAVFRDTGNSSDNEIFGGMYTILTPSCFTINGNIFNDLNKNSRKDSGEPNYSGNPSITASRGTVTTNANGTYNVSSLSSGTVTISLTSLPPNYVLVYPQNGPPPSFQVTVGPACNTNGAFSATCSLGEIDNLNFAINNSYPWTQAVCGDYRKEDIFNNKVPAGEQALITNTSCTSPGIIFPGSNSASFGQGQSSSTDQVVGGTNYPEVYSPPTIGGIFSSYASLTQRMQLAGITPTNLASVCNLSNCTLPANLPHGIYQATGNVVLNGYTFPANQDYVFLINGTLTLQGNQLLNAGATALFSSSGNLIIPSTVGTVPPATTPNLQGIFSTDKSIVMNSNGVCNNDLRLNLEGVLILNASRTGGGIQNSRDLCGANLSNPVLLLTQRLDIILNLPEFLKTKTTISNEVAP